MAKKIDAKCSGTGGNLSNVFNSLPHELMDKLNMAMPRESGVLMDFIGYSGSGLGGHNRITLQLIIDSNPPYGPLLRNLVPVMDKIEEYLDCKINLIIEMV